MSNSTRASEAEVFREAIESCGNNLIIEMARERKRRRWHDADEWMLNVTENYIVGVLPPEKIEAFHELMHIGIMLGESPRDPRDFIHPSLPDEALILCAQTYRTAGILRAAARNPTRRMPRKDLYIAWKLGLITDAELAAAPPLFRGEKIKQRKPAWQKRLKRPT